MITVGGKEWRVVAWTPYGRERTVSILAEYMRRDHEREIVDEYWLCQNTDPNQVDDLAYMYRLNQDHPWVKIQERPAHFPRRVPKQRNTGSFYYYMTDPDTVYVRLDDDIVYVHPDAITNLATAKIQMAVSVAVHATMWNNAVTSWYFQKAGVIPAPGDTTQVRFDGGHETYTWPEVGGPWCMDPVGWTDGRFAVALHRLLLDRIEAGEPESCYLYQDMPWKLGEQFSVSAFASLGTMYAGLDEPGVLVPDEEENWHTVHQPKVIGHPNIINGNSLVSHYTFFPQQTEVFKTDVLDQYRALATNLTN